VEGGIAWMTLARPESHNRLDDEMLGALVEGCAQIEDMADVRVVIVAARGPVFSAGLPRGCGAPDPAWPRGVEAVAAISRPVIAALQGGATGWGMALALACDLRVAAAHAVLAVRGAERGWFPGGGVTPRLARIVGVARTFELVLLGARLDAARALEWGLVSAVVESSGLRPAVEDLARALERRGPLALRLGKEAVLRSLDLPLADGMRLEEDLYVLLQTTADRREGVRAFLRGRAPRFGAR
jgi:enoyl-CoA hydratase/carnithine racemase